MRRITTVRMNNSAQQEDIDAIGIDYDLMGSGDIFFPCHEGVIEAGTRRKHGIWQQLEDYGDFVFFTCPWCGGVNSIKTWLIDREFPNSIWCTKAGCERHLFVEFRGFRG